MRNDDAFQALAKVQEVIRRLLGPDGCPWDRKQTPLSLSEYVIEESFELVEAIRSGSPSEVREEMGDLAFLLLFLAKLYEDAPDGFSLDQALEYNAAKMIRRHPHVFADASVSSQDDVLRNWEQIKAQERKDRKEDDKKNMGVFSGLPKGLPALTKAYRLHSTAARQGFTWESDQDAQAQFEAERAEWDEAVASGEPARMEEEFGDLLFTLVELGRRKGIKAAQALDASNAKFLERFETMEALARERGVELTALNFSEMDELWNQAKARLAQHASDKS